MLVAAVGGVAAADDRTEVRLRPWITPEAELHGDLATGNELSIDVAGGALFSPFATSAVVVETGALGHYFASSPRQAWSVELLEKAELAIDSTTPQFGMLGVGLRRLGRQQLGGVRALNFERVAAGLAVMSRGTNLVTGIGAELAGGTFTLCGSGFALHVDGYFFGRPDAFGVDTIFTVSLGYIFTPSARHVRFVEPPPPPPVAPPPPALVPIGPPCADEPALQQALADRRRASASACTAARDDASRVDECNRESDAVVQLRSKLERCQAGHAP